MWLNVPKKSIMQNADQVNTILILGQSGSSGLSGQPGKPGVNSVEDNTGQPGSDGSYSGGWSSKCTAATNGTKGANGATGGDDGLPGNDGVAPYPFTMRVDTFVFPNGGQMNILSKGGDGGTGGDGGQGGGGDAGGDAGNTSGGTNDKYDKNCLAKGKCPPATGGPGGDGAPGGKGGKGGNSGGGGFITIYYKNGNNLNQVVISTPAGNVGNPGKPGAGGQGGQGGKNEIWPQGSPQTYGFTGRTGAVTGDNGGGLPGPAGSIDLIPMT